jgi:3-oxoacyl-[acyl-carrier-protein] synthase III
VPPRVVENGPIAERLGVTDDWIASRTGIRRRHVAEPEDRLADLAARAGAAALRRAGVDGSQLDLVLVATTTQDEVTPNTAPQVAGRLGASQAAAIDVGAACTAWLSAFALATGQIEAGRARHALVVGADMLSRLTDRDDRRTAGLFGDGAGAVVLRGTRPPGRVSPIALHSDHTGADLIRAGWEDRKIRMKGPETFKTAVTRLADVTLEALALEGAAMADIDLFVYHQANSRILRAVGERLELPTERVVDCLAGYGNTSAASIPIALAEAQRDGRLRRGSRVLLGAFGAGLTWGACIVEWEGDPDD